MADSSRSGDAPMISVALPVFNGARTLALAIASVRAQTETRWELIVIDDGSNDGSERIVAAIAKRDPQRARIAMSEHFTVGVEPLTEHLVEMGVIQEADRPAGKTAAG